MRFLMIFVALSAISSAPADAQQTTPDVATVRRELEQRYAENVRAYLAKDFNAIMALRTEDFHSVTPDSVVHNRADMEQYIRGFLNGIDRWISTSFDIDSLEVSGDLATAIVRQHADRMALRADGKVHHLETWVTQREIWRKTSAGWKLYRVDGIRDQRRLIDGKA